jgi:hypothetical protein
MAEETIGRATVQLGADGSKLGPEMAAAVAKAQGQLTRANRQMERAHAQVTRQIQRHIDRIKATRPTQEMRLLEQAVQKLGGSSKLSSGEVRRLRGEVDRLAAAGAKVPKSLAGLQTRGGLLGGRVRGVGAAGAGLFGLSGGALAGGALAFGATRLAGGSLEALSTQEEAVNALNLALANQGNFTQAASLGLQAYASELQGVTRYGDEAILSVQSLLASFGNSEQQIRALTPVILDFAAATGKDLKVATEALLNAQKGETGELEKYIGKIDPAIKGTDRFNIVVDRLTKAFGGSAQAAAKSFAGQMDQVTNAAGDAQEALGKFLTFAASSGAQPSPIFKWLEWFFGNFMVHAVAEARVLILKLFGGLASAAQKIATLPLFKPLFGEAQGFQDFVNSIDFQIEDIRQKANTFAAGGVGTLPVTNAPKGAPPPLAASPAQIKAQEAAAAAAKRHQEAIDALAASLTNAAAQAAVNDLAEAFGQLKAGELTAAGLEKVANALRRAREEGAAIPPIFDGLVRALEQIESGADGFNATLQDMVDQVDTVSDEEWAQLDAQIKATVPEVQTITREAVDWRGALEDVSNIVQSLPGPLQGVARVFSGITAGISGIFTSLGNIGKGQGLAGLLSNVAGIGGIATSAIGIVGSLSSAIGGLFRDEEEEVNDLRDAFLESQGGWLELQKTLARITDEDLVKQIFDAATVDQFNAAVEKTKGLLDTQTEAQEELNAALAKYGFEDQLAQAKELSDQGAQLFKEWELLTKGGLIPAGDAIRAMGPNLVDFVNKSREAGQAIPEAMRPMVEQLIASGQLVDENGNAFESAEDAGVTFAQTMSEQFQQLIDKLDQWLSALSGAQPAPITVPVNYASSGVPTGVPPDVRLPGSEIPEFASGSGGFRDFGAETLVRLHGREAVVPEPRGLASYAGSADALLAAVGSGLPREVGGSSRDGRGGDVFNTTLNLNEDPYQSAEGRWQLRRRTLRIVEEETSKNLAALIRAGKA